MITENIPNNESDNKGAQVGSRSFVAALGLFFLEVIKMVVLAGVTIALVRTFLFKPFYVKGKSMEPTFHENEYLIIDKLTYRLRALEHEPQVERGEVVVIVSPVNPSEHYLKRIIGLPGERVTIRNGQIIIYNTEHAQGFVLNESYLVEPTPNAEKSVLLGESEYFVMGDNRDESFDSRGFGPITFDGIVGRAWFRGWPLSRTGIFKTPTYPNDTDVQPSVSE